MNLLGIVVFCVLCPWALPLLVAIALIETIGKRKKGHKHD